MTHRGWFPACDITVPFRPEGHTACWEPQLGNIFFQREELPSIFKNWRWVICLSWEGSRHSCAQLSGSPPAGMQAQDAQTTWCIWSKFYSSENSQPEACRGLGWWCQYWDSGTEVLSLELTPKSGWAVSSIQWSCREVDTQDLLTCCAGCAFCFPVSSL